MGNLTPATMQTRTLSNCSSTKRLHVGATRPATQFFVLCQRAGGRERFGEGASKPKRRDDSDWYEGPSTSDRAPRDYQPKRDSRSSNGFPPVRRTAAGRPPSTRPGPPGTGRGTEGRASGAPRGPRDNFLAMHEKLKDGQADNFVIRQEAWAKLFSHMATREHAELAMSLMLKDAAVRDANNWDWQAQGYGQTIFQLVKAAGAVGVFQVCNWVLDNAATLRLTVGNDTVPNMMRKLAGVGVDVVEIERLYALEKRVRGSNSNSGFYELSRVYKRSGSTKQIQELLEAARADGVALKEEIVEDLEAWLAKRT